MKTEWLEWFKIVSEVYIKPGAQTEQLNGKPAQTYHYKIVPYTRFIQVTSKNQQILV